MDLVVEPVASNAPARVFASLANGTVIVFQHTPNCSKMVPSACENNDESLELEKNEWMQSDVSIQIHTGFVTSKHCFRLLNIARLLYKFILENIQFFQA